MKRVRPQGLGQNIAGIVFDDQPRPVRNAFGVVQMRKRRRQQSLPVGRVHENQLKSGVMAPQAVEVASRVPAQHAAFFGQAAGPEVANQGCAGFAVDLDEQGGGGPAAEGFN